MIYGIKQITQVDMSLHKGYLHSKRGWEHWCGESGFDNINDAYRYLEVNWGSYNDDFR